MNYKRGQVLHWCSVEIDDDTGKVSIKWEEYIVRTIRKGEAWATWKNSVSWGKRSKKHGDFGWLVPTPDWMTERVTGVFASYLKTTKLQAVNHELKNLRGKWHGYEDHEVEVVKQRLLAVKKRLKGGKK